MDLQDWARKEKARGELPADEQRLLRIIGKHLRDEDMKLSDRDFIEAMIVRWRKHLAAEIVDVGE